MKLADTVRDATEAAVAAPQLAEALLALLQTWVGLAAILGLLVLLLLNGRLQAIVEMFERGERRRLELLDRYLAQADASDGSIKSVVRDAHDRYFFRAATGIDAESKRRVVLLDVYERTSHKVTWRDVRRAERFIDADDKGRGFVRPLSVAQKLAVWYNNIAGIFFLLVSGLLMALIIVPGEKTFGRIAVFIASAIGMALVGVFALSQNSPEHASLRISKELQEQEKRKAD